MGQIAAENINNGEQDLFSYKITVAAVQGGRKYMEDRVHIEAVRDLYGNLCHLYAAIYDGHGGAQASEYVREHLHENIKSIKSFYSDDDQEVLSAIRQGFIKTHHNMQKMLEQWPMTNSGFPCTAGTTASVAIIRKNKLYTGHVGDSVIVMANCLNSSVFTCKLTEDHKPDNENERNRIENTGGAVAVKAGVHRVIWKRPIRGHLGPIRRSTSTENIPFLAVARALGDFWSLNPDNNEYVVSPDPDVSVIQLKPTDEFIVLASDGLTNVMRPRRMAENLRNLAYSGLNSNSYGFWAKNQNISPNYAQFMLKEALDSWCFVRADNISVICIQLINSKAKASSSISPTLNNKQYGEEPSILCASECPFMDIDKEFTDFPAAMICVTQKTTRRFLTNPVKLIYTPAPNGPNGQIYKGPGFVVPQPPNQCNEEELSDDEISLSDDYFSSVSESSIPSNLLSEPCNPTTASQMTLIMTNNRKHSGAVTINAGDCHLSHIETSSSSSISYLESNSVELKMDNYDDANVDNAIHNNSGDDETNLDETIVETECEDEKITTSNSSTTNQFVNDIRNEQLLNTENISVPLKKASPMKLFLSKGSPLSKHNKSSVPSKFMKSSMKKKGLNEKIFSKCHSFGELVFNDFLSSNAFTSSSKSYTVTKKEDIPSKTNGLKKNTKKSDFTSASTSRFTSFGFLRSGKIFNGSSSASTLQSVRTISPDRLASSTGTFSSSMPVPSTPINTVSHSTTDLTPSTLLSPFAVLATIRSSSSALRTSNSEMILSHRRSAPTTTTAMTSTQSQPIKQCHSPRSPCLTYDEKCLMKKNEKGDDKKETILSPNLHITTGTTTTSSVSVSSSSSSSNVTPKRNVRNRQPVYHSQQNAVLAECVDDIYKFPTESPKRDKLLTTPSSSSTFKTTTKPLETSRKRPSRLLPDASNSDSGCSGKYMVDKTDTHSNSTVSKRIRLSRQSNSTDKLSSAYLMNNSGAAAVVLTTDLASNNGNGLSTNNNSTIIGQFLRDNTKPEISTPLSSSTLPKRQQSRGIWNFVSAVFSKYIS